jgi:UDP-galactopyranose mutase
MKKTQHKSVLQKCVVLSQEKEFVKIWGKFEETRSEKYVIFGGTFAEFFRILFGKLVWMSSKFGFNYEVLL